MRIDTWNGLFVGLVTAAVVFAAVFEVRSRARTWRWWGVPALLAGWVLTVGVVTSRLDKLGKEGSLSAHVAQHVVLGDLAAPLLLLGVSPALGSALDRGYARLTRGDHALARIATLGLSPVGAALIWAGMTYVWLVPSLPRLAIPAGPVHMLDHASFLVFGLLVWLAAFDFRRVASVDTWDALVAALRTGGLPWWGRHVYAMATRFLMLPAILMLWLMPSAAYYLPGQLPPGGLTRHEDQVQAASLMLGFEILLFALSLILLFVFAAVSEGRRREEAR